MSGTLALASTIAAFDHEALSALVRARHVAAPAQVKDPIDLAIELLKPDSISRALSGLTRSQLADLLRVDDAMVDAHSLVLTGLVARDSESGRPLPLPEVMTGLHSALKARGLSAEDLRIDAGTSSLDAARGEGPDTSGWYAPALTTVAQCAWVIREFTRNSPKLNRGGTIASSWLKALEERIHVPRIEELLQLLRTAGLVSALQAEVTFAGHEWLRGSPEDRWMTLAVAAVDLAPTQLLAIVSADADDDVAASIDSPRSVASSLTHSYPLIEDATRSAAASAVELWRRLGIVFEGAVTRAGWAVVSGSLGADAGGADAPGLGFPPAAVGVYIQPDLSVVVPGPLSQHDEADIARLTVPEQIGVASTLRITEASLGEALDRGSSADEIRASLERLSLTGIPQPLDYLVTSLSERAGTVVVSEHHGDAGRSRIDFARADLRAMIKVDRSLSHLQLHADPEAAHGSPGATEAGAAGEEPLFSRLRPDHVLAALVDARYPARAHHSLGVHAHALDQTAGRRDEAAGAPGAELDDAAPEGPADPLDSLVTRVLAAAADGPGDISRQITLAIRDRQPLLVTVEIHGDRRSFSLLPVSISAGRMRALDEAAGVERTFPVDAITEVVAS